MIDSIFRPLESAMGLGTWRHIRTAQPRAQQTEIPPHSEIAAALPFTAPAPAPMPPPTLPLPRRLLAHVSMAAALSNRRESDRDRSHHF
jgi:hypothetical protein